MKRALTALTVLLALAAAYLVFSPVTLLDYQEKVRPAMVAGSFYPAGPAQIRAVVDGFINSGKFPKTEGSLFALVAPHAGYQFSGQVAGHAYALLKGRRYKRVVVIAPSHLESFSYASVYNGDAYTTPLGRVQLDKRFAEELADSSPLLRLSNSGHGWVMGRGEHSLENQLPFLQQTLGDFKLVPIIMGTQNYEVERALGVALAKLIKVDPVTHQPDTLIVASSDLSHYHPYDEAVKLDRMVLGAIADGDVFSLSRNAQHNIWEACGGGSIVAAMMAAERLGANSRVILNYANSGDVTGDKSRVVGYSAAAIARNDNIANDNSKPFITLSDLDKETLLGLAKKSVESAVRENKAMSLPANLPEALQNARGAFVTLKKNGRLRGCIGYTVASKTLAETVRDVAALAATNDRRFRPVKPDELGKLDYEISVLSPLHRVKNVEDIRVGRDGLLIKRGEAEGLLLPQVPVEQRWNRDTFLEETSVKAGLMPNAWQAPDADLYAFEAVVLKKY